MKKDQNGTEQPVHCRSRSDLEPSMDFSEFLFVSVRCASFSFSVLIYEGSSPKLGLGVSGREDLQPSQMISSYLLLISPLINRFNRPAWTHPGCHPARCDCLL